MPAKKNETNVFIETLDWICKKIENANIQYMITGGSAVGFWGHIRTTMDIDILIQIKDKQVETFLKSFKEDAYINIEEATKSIYEGRMFNVISHKTFFKIDLIPLKDDEYEMEKFERKVKINFLNRDIYVISPEDLIISKLIWSKSAGGSERQIKDCASIYKLNYDMLNMTYIRKWIKKLKIEDEFKKLLS